ncbi:MAG: lipoprotein-releasing ABC transporter permease subunit, partial [Thermodesulfobacteriota bacterium]|nr:lipoprotein-releasing ABC transporter permease subunit [Thermodesulfobacteriota bacterium]
IMTFEYFIGNRYLRVKQTFISLITILSIAGIAIGVMALIIVIAVMSGAESEFRSRILGVESHVMIMRYGSPFTDYRGIIKDIEKIDGVKTASPYVFSQIMLRSSSRVSGAVLRGIDPGSAGQAIKSLDKTFLEQRLTKNQNAGASAFVPGIILGQELARNLGVIENDIIYLISPRGMISPIGHIPAMKRFRVTGLFESGMYEYDTSLAYVHLKHAQSILHIGDSVTNIGVRVKDIYKANNIAENIAANLNEKYKTGSYWARDWMQMNRNLFSALKLEKKAMFIILTLIVLVAAFNIASSLIMMVMGKTKDIAILKAMGATDKSIRRIFVFKGMIVGLTGTILGMCLGLTGCILLKHYKFIKLPGDVYYFTTLPVKLEALDVFVIVSATMIICYLATLYPARQASKLNPVEAIRYG